jgi:DNA-binding MarR family transcriptional regulator
MNNIIIDNTLTPFARLLYLYLSELDKTNITNSELAETFNKTKICISYTLSDLAKAGYIKLSNSMAGERNIKVL